MPFLRLFDFEPTVMTERTFASLSNLHIKKTRQKEGGCNRKKSNNNKKKFQKLFSVWIMQKPILACFNKMTVL